MTISFWAINVFDSITISQYCGVQINFGHVDKVEFRVAHFFSLQR